MYGITGRVFLLFITKHHLAKHYTLSEIYRSLGHGIVLPQDD